MSKIYSILNLLPSSPRENPNLKFLNWKQDSLEFMATSDLNKNENIQKEKENNLAKKNLHCKGGSLSVTTYQNVCYNKQKFF